MKIIHISDTHSLFPSLPDGEVIIHSGDLLPNISRGNKDNQEAPFQTNWIKENITQFQQWIEDRTFIFCQGNHDYISPVSFFQQAGIKAFDITNQLLEFNGLKIYGFPYIPVFDIEEWNWQIKAKEMSQQIRKLKDLLKQKIDILVCHCPPYGILDQYKENHWGNIQLADMFNYGLNQEFFPKYLLTGHVHSSPGNVEEWGIKIYQSALIIQEIQIN